MENNIFFFGKKFILIFHFHGNPNSKISIFPDDFQSALPSPEDKIAWRPPNGILLGFVRMFRTKHFLIPEYIVGKSWETNCKIRLSDKKYETKLGWGLKFRTKFERTFKFRKAELTRVTKMDEQLDLLNFWNFDHFQN